MTSRIAIVLGLVSGLAISVSATANAKVLEHIVFHNNTTVASFDNSQPITCADLSEGAISTHVTLNGFEFFNKSTSNGTVRRNVAVVSLSQFNSCTFENVFGVGEADGGFTQDGLKSARFQATVTIGSFDIPPIPVGTAVVNITVTGTGPVTVNKQHFRFTFVGPDGPIVQSIHSDGKSVGGILSGTFSFNGANIPLPSPEFIFSEIAVTKAGTMQHLKK